MAAYVSAGGVDTQLQDYWSNKAWGVAMLRLTMFHVKRFRTAAYPQPIKGLM